MTPDNQDDELLRSYLLGKLPDEDADGLEGRLLADDDLFDLAEAVELDLLAAVDRGDLTPAEGEEILRKLAASPRGRERLALARSLNALAGRKPLVPAEVLGGQTTEKTGISNVTPFARRTPAFPPLAIRWMALAASLVLMTGLSWFAWQIRMNASETQQRVVTPAPTPQPLAPPATPVTTARTETTPKSTPDQFAPRQEAHQTVRPAILTLSFSALLRDAGESPKLTLAPGARTVEIEIDGEGLGDAKSFDAVVRIKNQETVIMEKKGLAISSLFLGGSGLSLKIPAGRLPAGRYEVAVTPQGGEEVSRDFEVVAGKR